MEVSTFELLYKPLTPTGGDIARRVLQGYFLTGVSDVYTWLLQETFERAARWRGVGYTTSTQGGL